jgi:hypothetical protein
MKVSSRDFHREIRASLAPLMRAAGFTASKGGSAGWERPAAAGLLSLWFQVDKWGWDPLWGARFNLEFALGEVAGARSAGGRTERLGMLVEGFAELEELRLLNNAVIADLPGTREGRLVTQRLRGGGEIVVQGCRPDPAPFETGFDYWLTFYSVEDARRWGAWFAQRMPRLITLFENDQRSPLGEGRRRFDRVMGQVQALPAGEREAKAAMFEAYMAQETIPYWKSAAAYWIAEIRERGGAGATL